MYFAGVRMRDKTKSKRNTGLGYVDVTTSPRDNPRTKPIELYMYTQSLGMRRIREYTPREFLINGRRVRARSRWEKCQNQLTHSIRNEKSFFSFYFFFLTQVFNLIGQKRLRYPNSKCACATAKRLGMLKEETCRKGGLYGKTHAKGYGPLFLSFFVRISKLITIVVRRRRRPVWKLCNNIIMDYRLHITDSHFLNAFLSLNIC